VSAATWRVAVGGAETTAVHDRAEGGDHRVVFVFAHGAGGHMGDGAMLKARDALLARGIDLVRFNFLYKERGSGRPDPMPALMQCVTAVVERTREELKPEVMVIGGRSMGGRAASMLAAEGFETDGLLLMAYPLHPAGQPEKLRDAHLPRIRVPVLCINGTRDALCRKDLMTRAIDGLGWQMQWLEGKDHSFAVTDEIGELAKRWAAAMLKFSS